VTATDETPQQLDWWDRLYADESPKRPPRMADRLPDWRTGQTVQLGKPEPEPEPEPVAPAPRRTSSTSSTGGARPKPKKDKPKRPRNRRHGRNR
jgi:hypothetical protein